MHAHAQSIAAELLFVGHIQSRTYQQRQMAAMRSPTTVGAGLVQPLPARVAAFRPVARSQKSPVAPQATSEKSQVAQKFATLGAAATTVVAAGSAQAADVATAVSDNRAALLATVFIPALGWVAYNILGPALNQYKNMRLKSVATGLGLTAASLLVAQQADAANQVAELAAGDNRAAILAVVFVPALGWVAFNILGPALNQYKNMTLKKSVAAGLGLGGASMLLAQQADAANQVSEIAAGDNRALILAVVFVPAVGWVAFNILGPALNQLSNMTGQGAPKGKGGRKR